MEEYCLAMLYFASGLFFLFFSIYFSVRAVDSREGIKDEILPTERPPAIFVWFVFSARIFLAKAVYTVLGSS